MLSAPKYAEILGLDPRRLDLAPRDLGFHDGGFGAGILD
jgi:hypothetical protein